MKFGLRQGNADSLVRKDFILKFFPPMTTFLQLGVHISLYFVIKKFSAAIMI